VRIMRVVRLVPETFTERFIRLVLEEVTVVGNPAEHVTKARNDQGADECPTDLDGPRVNHCPRQDKTLGWPGQHKVGEREGDQEDVNGKVALARLVVREDLPAEAV